MRRKRGGKTWGGSGEIESNQQLVRELGESACLSLHLSYFLLFLPPPLLTVQTRLRLR